MSQKNTFPLVNENSSATDDGFDDTQEKLTTVGEETGWANFNAFENPSQYQTRTISTESRDEDQWTEFESNPTSFIQHSLQRSNDNGDDDGTFGDYGEVQIAPNSQTPIQSMNSSLNTEQIATLISTCFPLQPSLTAANQSISFALTSFTTFKDHRRQLPCFEPSLSLWNALSNISNDPLGIKYQWRRSNSERLFHQALGVHERPQTKTISHVAETSPSDIDNTTQISSPIIIEVSSPAKESDQDLSRSDDKSPSVQTLLSDKADESIASPVVVHQNHSPMLSRRPTSIKTIDLFPGSTTTLNDDTKPVIDSVPNFHFIDPRALMF